MDLENIKKNPEEEQPIKPKKWYGCLWRQLRSPKVWGSAIVVALLTLAAEYWFEEKPVEKDIYVAEKLITEIDYRATETEKYLGNLDLEQVRWNGDTLKLEAAIFELLVQVTGQANDDFRIYLFNEYASENMVSLLSRLKLYSKPDGSMQKILDDAIASSMGLQRIQKTLNDATAIAAVIKAKATKADAEVEAGSKAANIAALADYNAEDAAKTAAKTAAKAKAAATKAKAEAVKAAAEAVKARVKAESAKATAEAVKAEAAKATAEAFKARVKAEAAFVKSLDPYKSSLATKHFDDIAEEAAAEAAEAKAKAEAAADAADTIAEAVAEAAEAKAKAKAEAAAEAEDAVAVAVAVAEVVAEAAYNAAYNALAAYNDYKAAAVNKVAADALVIGEHLGARSMSADMRSNNSRTIILRIVEGIAIQLGNLGAVTGEFYLTDVRTLTKKVGAWCSADDAIIPAYRSPLCLQSR